MAEPSTSTKTDFLLTSKYSGIGVGSQLGLPFTIAKVIVFDMFIPGPEANSAKHDVVIKDPGTAIPWNLAEAEAKQELQDAICRLPERKSRSKRMRTTYRIFELQRLFAGFPQRHFGWHPLLLK